MPAVGRLHRTAENFRKFTGVNQSNKIDAQLYFSGTQLVLEERCVNIVIL
jgi:hypothetical protein